MDQQALVGLAAQGAQWVVVLWVLAASEAVWAAVWVVVWETEWAAV